VTRKEIHDEKRDGGRYENELINQRLSWFGTLQGLLFAALAVAWNDPSAMYLIWIICGVGLLVAISIGVGTYRANRRLRLDKLDPDDGDPFVLRQIVWRLMPGRFIPWVFALAWVFIFLLRRHAESADGSVKFPFL